MQKIEMLFSLNTRNISCAQLNKSNKSNKMPTPPLQNKINPNLLCEQFYQLHPIKTIISNGQTYYLDVEAHDDLVNYKRQIYNEFNEIDPSSEQTRHAHEQYLQVMFTYTLIDEDRKICGVYDISTKTFQMYLRRTVMPDGNIYYQDNDNHLWSYAGSYLGQGQPMV
jgi:hypothetical protein